MATVTSLTAPRMLEIEANSVVDGTVDENGHLKLTTHGGEVIDAGKVKGDKGEPGGVGPAGPASSPNPEPIAPAGLSVSSNTAFHTAAGQPVSTVVFNWPIPILDILGDTPAIDGYELWYRIPTTATATLLAQIQTNTATVTTMEPGVEYRVKVRAHTFQGQWGAFSPEINVIPAVPSDAVPQEPGDATIISNVGAYRSDGRAEAIIHFTWDAVIDSTTYDPLGIRTYEIWLTTDGVATPIIQTPETEVYLTFPSGSAVDLKVRAMSNFGIWGDFSASDVVTAAFPVQNNAAATVPILTTNMGVVYSNWNGNIGSSPAGPEFQHLITEVAPVAGGPWTAIGIPAVSAGNTAVIPSTPGANVSVRFRWRDKLGRLSTGISPVASITVLGIDQTDFTPDLSDVITNLEAAVISVVTEYAVNSSETVPPSSGWSTATPARTPGTFVWMRTTTNYADGTSTTSSPVLVTGNTGASGGTGAPGKGISSTAVTYQVHSNGTTAPTGTWVASPPATSPGQFLWTRTITTYTDATTTTAYSVAAHGATGANGTNGAAGAPGVGVSSTVVTYQVHSSGTVAPTGTWLSSPAATSPGQFLWTRTVTTYTDASTSTAYSVAAHGATGPTGSTGAAGKGISATTVTYQVHSSGTVAPTGTWTSTPGVTSPGQFLWTRTVIDYTDASQVTVYGVSAHGATGATGSTGSTGAAGTDATNVVVGNDAVAIPTDPSGATITTYALTIPFSGWIGNARAAATIAASGLPTGITAGTNTPATTGADGSLILNVASGSILGGTTFGEITLTITCNSKTFVKKFSWSKAPQGATGATGSTGGTGATGAAATSIDVGNEAAVIPCTSAGATVGASTITIPFTGFVGNARAAATVVVSGLPTGITVQTNTAGTSGAAGTLVLAVASGSALGGTDFGNITLTITCNSLTFVQLFSWSKAIAGATGATGSTGGTGAAGTDATNVVVGNDAVAIPTDPAGATTTTYALTIPFSGWIGNARAAATIVASGLPTGITAGTNTPATTGADGSLILNVASGSSLGGTTFGEITLTITCNSKTFVKKFSWSKAPQGATGSTGSTGAAGKGISTTVVDYQASSSGTVAPTGTWVASPPVTTPGQYLWTRTVITYTDATSTTAYMVAKHGDTGATGSTGGTGPAGKGISSTVVTYQADASGTVVPTGTWVSSPPATTPGQYLWTRTVITYTDASSTTSYAISKHGDTGATGSTGAAATSIDVGNEAAVIPCTSAGATVGASTITIPFTGFVGNTRAAATVVVSGLPTGITVSTNTPGTSGVAGSLVLAVASGSTLGGTTDGNITLTITCNSLTFVQTFSWSKAVAGAAGATGGTGAAGADATNVVVGNDAVAIPTNPAGATVSTIAITIPFGGYVGNARAAATVVASGLPTGITAGTNTPATGSADGSLILNVASASTLGGTSFGEITLTFTCNSKTFVKKFSWSKAPQGATGATGSTGGTGSAGVSATSVDVGNEAAVIPCTSAGATVGASTITIPFTGFIGNARAAATVVVSGLPTGITVQTNTPGTTGAAGTLVLAVASASTLGGASSGDITLTITVNSIVFVQLFSWSKGIAGATGSTGGTGPAGKGVSSVTPYYLQQGTGVAAPAAPTTNPPGGSWTITEPGYLASTELYRAELFVFTDATFGWTSVSKVSAYTASTQAMTAANLADAAAHGMVKASQTDPGHSAGRIWLVLNASSQVIGIKISNGSAWSSYVLMADQILVPSSVGTVSIADGAVNAPKVNAASIWADEAWLNVLRAGIIEASMVTASFGAELSLESNIAVSTIITTQTAQAIELNSVQTDLEGAVQDIDGLATGLGTVGGTANAAKTAAQAAQAAANAAQASIAYTQTWFRVDAAGAHVGQSGSPFQTHIYPDRFAITDNGVETTTWSSGKMTVNIVEALRQILIGKHQIEPYPNPLVATPTGTIIRSIS